MLSQELDRIRKISNSYKEGLHMAILWVNNNNGHIEKLDNNETKLSLHNESAICFQLYKDIDKFYYEN